MRTMMRARFFLASLLAVPALCNAEDFDFLYRDSMESGYAQAWRVFSLALRDPHVFADVPVFGCVDFTDTPIPVANISLNGEIANALATDGDGDGFLDANSLTLADHLDADGVGQMLTSAQGQCASPSPPLACSLTAPLPGAVPASNAPGKNCLAALAGTTSGYSPPVPVIMPNCFVTAPAQTTVMLDTIEITLNDAQTGATWSMDTQFHSPALMRGFLTETDADNTLLPAELPVIGGQPLSSILPGGVASCAPGDDRDQHLGENGWWFYLEYQSEQIDFTIVAARDTAH